MGLARDLERRLEQLVDGLASRIFRGRVHPVELGTRLEREADLAVFETPAGPAVPNAFDITMGGEPEAEDAVRAAERELEDVMSQSAAERGWRLEGPISVRIHFGEGPPSAVSLVTSVEPGQLEPWAHLQSPGRELPVRFNRSIVGRSSDADIHLQEEEVSRWHALLWREAGGMWLADLGSSNGTFLNGARCTDVVDVLNGDHIGFAGVELVMRSR